jgi:CheY-like chemotaxis protein
MSRVLVIDDDDQMLDVLSQILARAGYEVVKAVNGREGLASVRANPVDLVVTDLLMPEMEGIETIMELRREFPGTRIIAISGGAKRGIHDFLPLAKRLGAERVLAKPFERQDLLDAVEGVLA